MKIEIAFYTVLKSRCNQVNHAETLPVTVNCSKITPTDFDRGCEKGSAVL